MNPRPGQYALGGTLSAWTRLASPTARQKLVLRSTYAGLNPRTYGRYGSGQWRAPLPWTRLVVKDPFAMLSIPAISRVTRAVPILVYRHPGAVLTSYRRMGWSPDLGEVQEFVHELAKLRPSLAASWDGINGFSEAGRMAMFWCLLNVLALDDCRRVPGSVVVAHHEIASGGTDGVAALFEQIGLAPSQRTAMLMAETGRPSKDPATGSLHQLDRAPSEVAESWRGRLPEDELSQIEDVASEVIEDLERARLTW